MKFVTLERPLQRPAGDAVGRELERLLTRRRLQHDSWMERAKTWEANRPTVAGLVEFPRDQAQVIALGVPCVDCLQLVWQQAPVGARFGAGLVLEDDDEDGELAVAPVHEVTFMIRPGEHWSRFVAARCYR